MADSILSEVAGNVVGKLGTFVLKEVSFACGLETELEKIKEMLIAIKAVILDAEQQQGQSEGAKLWVEKLAQVLYDTEDVLDEFDYEVLRNQVVKRMSTSRKVRRFFSTSNPLVFRFKMGHKLKNLRERVAEIAELKSKLGLTERIYERHVIRRDKEMTHSYVDAADVIGRVDDKEIIYEKLVQSVDSENVSVIPIVGIGGLGKTTLAKLVYNDQRVNDHFDSRLWVCTSDEFELQKVIVKILKDAGEEYQDMDLNQLQVALRGTLNAKKYLLVMDDVWNEDGRKWDDLRSLLKVGAEGSKILVTTRSNEVASIMGTVDRYELQGLPQKNCLSLFFKCAFKQRQEQQYPNLMRIGEEIVRKCSGVPLAVTTLGYLLSGTTNQHDWEYVRDSEMWRLKQKDEDIMPALKLSYIQLPGYLKRCFTYFSLFPKDYEFHNFHATYFWMAYGLLQSSNPEEELEDTGMRYWNELRSRGFLQDHKDKELLGVIKCKMHDLVHDLALWVTQNESFIATPTNQHIPKNVRHLFFSQPHLFSRDYFTSLTNLEQARTVILEEEDTFNFQSIVETCFARCEHVRAIDLSWCQFEILPRRIGTLKHLRFLNLGGNYKIRKLPNSICKLQHLQTLVLGDCEKLEELPRNIKYLVGLRCLLVTISGKRLPEDGIGCLNSLRILEIGGCENLEYLMDDMQGLKSLRNLRILKCKKLISLPQSMKYLTNLETLIIGDCENLDLTMEEDNSNSSQLKLRTLILIELPKLMEVPQWLLPQSANTLQSLRLESCDKLKQLPTSLQNQTAIQELVIGDCAELGERCKPNAGEDWHKIAHIPQILVDSHNLKKEATY